MTSPDDASAAAWTRCVYPVYKTSSVSVVDGDVAMRSNGGPAAAGTPQQVQLARERMALSPERLLITALDASDTHIEPDTTLQSVPQNVVTFTLDGAPVRIYLNAYTHLPTAVDYSGPLAHSNFWAFLGDVTMRTYYGEWWLAKGGIHLPMQMNVEGNGHLDQMLVIRKLQIDAPLKEADLTIPAEVRAQFHPDAKPRDMEQIPLGDPKELAKELTPGIVFIPGSWNITLVKQEDGVVVLEAPISSGYSAEVIAEAHRRFPGVPVRAVITTSDSWPHFAGIRQYVAEGIPIYALDLNRPILERVIDDPRKSRPDALARTPRKPQFHLLHEKTVLGTGAKSPGDHPDPWGNQRAADDGVLPRASSALRQRSLSADAGRLVLLSADGNGADGCGDARALAGGSVLHDAYRPNSVDRARQGRGGSGEAGHADRCVVEKDASECQVHTGADTRISACRQRSVRTRAPASPGRSPACAAPCSHRQDRHRRAASVAYSASDRSHCATAIFSFRSSRTPRPDDRGRSGRW